MSNQHDLIDEMLRNARNIAVVGMSDKPHRASFNIGRYLADNVQLLAKMRYDPKGLLNPGKMVTFRAEEVAAETAKTR